MIQSQYNQTARMALADAIVDAKARKNLSFEQLNEGTGLSLAFVVAALLGQHPLPAEAILQPGRERRGSPAHSEPSERWRGPLLSPGT